MAVLYYTMNLPIYDTFMCFTTLFPLLAIILFIVVCAFYKCKWAINSLYTWFVVFPFMGAVLALLRYAPILKPIVDAHPIGLPLYIVFLACCGHATGYRAITQYITLLFSVVCVVILMQISVYYDMQLQLSDVYLVFGIFYAAFCTKLKDLSLFEKAILNGPRLQILNRHFQYYSQDTLELAFKAHIIATMNVLFCLPLMEHAILLLLYVGYNLFMSYHILPRIKQRYYIFSCIELFHCAHISSSLARRYSLPKLLVNTPMTLLGVASVLFWVFVIDDPAYAGNIPKTGVLSGMRIGIYSFLETRFSQEKVATFTEGVTTQQSSRPFLPASQSLHYFKRSLLEIGRPALLV